jgi:hypothetical protein
METNMKAHIILLQEPPGTCYGFFWNLYYKKESRRKSKKMERSLRQTKGTKKSEKGRERAKTEIV